MSFIARSLLVICVMGRVGFLDRVDLWLLECISVVSVVGCDGGRDSSGGVESDRIRVVCTILIFFFREKIMDVWLGTKSVRCIILVIFVVI